MNPALRSKAIETVRQKHALGRRYCLGYENPPNRTLEGTMPCPGCGGVLRYRVSSYDGATRGECESRGCLGWAE